MSEYDEYYMAKKAIARIGKSPHGYLTLSQLRCTCKGAYYIFNKYNKTFQIEGCRVSLVGGKCDKG